MTRDNLQNNKINIKVIIFWGLIAVITILFAVLFAMKIYDTKIFDSYEDIERANLNLVYDITSGEGDYYVYIYSAKESNGKLVDTNRTDIAKSNEVLPTVFNYFNYVRRNERESSGNSDFYKIYGYNVNNREQDSNLKRLGLKLDQLPALVLVSGSEYGTPITDTTKIQSELQKLMK